ncbi:hypothetical protein [Chitinophaga pinensis]|uniref:Uncharacterized protein n=1 Tax=Chitinophaga pinensis TaxID=79329 RepID=A0A5C6LQ84_9BACT|nr:hypothetical protein [Chitinophaga pinensis]TWV98767.1 hypothetical protein FEF09_20295 [Chitinophaga pinensis]
MKRILQNTFLAVGIITIIPFVVTLGSTASIGAAIWISLFFIFCAAFPTYLAVLIYYFVKRKIENKVYAMICGALLPLSIYHLCMLLLIVIGFDKPWSTFVQTVAHEYTDEYGLPNILAILLTIAIPIADLLIDKIARDLKDYK